LEKERPQYLALSTCVNCITMPSNKSALLVGKDQPLQVVDTAIPTPGANDIIVKNHAVAVNTIDPVQATGFQIKQYPTVLGHDLAGEVYAVGEKVTRFKKGDRVIGHAWQFLTGQSEDGAFSLYVRIPAGNAAILPDKIPYTDGVVLPLAIDTAACGFYSKGYMGLNFPSIGAEPKNAVVVVYGGSSSVGLAAIQLAVNTGYKVIATSSPKNFDLCRQAGASAVLNYKDANVAKEIAKAVGNNKFLGLYNAIGIPESFEVVTPIMEELGGGFLANTKPPGDLPKNITAKFVLGVGDFSFPVWENFVTKALESGDLKCLPPAKVVGSGLESLQKAFELRDGYVSGQKVVVEL
jgi:NADPH:quinone reductase-like Zn-dependent oxidoreductase